jgi:hypothetical protein
MRGESAHTTIPATRTHRADICAACMPKHTHTLNPFSPAHSIPLPLALPHGCASPKRVWQGGCIARGRKGRAHPIWLLAPRCQTAFLPTLASPPPPPFPV